MLKINQAINSTKSLDRVEGEPWRLDLVRDWKNSGVSMTTLSQGVSLYLIGAIENEWTICLYASFSRS
ncbi:hypothetical protein C5167_025708 [Papaver somniferum]|uniref:Uncharacterized protein n=1 Tax=Papaver somniferum TaxID=3469 RepID=A0A4Y7JV23_PAPSO|nr:hypothetical protein C5167_025708 [Papaver somniferum]